MATKTKAKSTVVIAPEVQEAITKLQLGEVEQIEERLAAHLTLAEGAVAGLRQTKEALSRVASSLRHLLKAQSDRRSPRSRPRSVPAGRKHVDEPLPKLPRQGASKRRVESRKRVSRKPSREDFQNNSDLPF